jgi:hypothetical protein
LYIKITKEKNPLDGFLLFSIPCQRHLRHFLTPFPKPGKETGKKQQKTTKQEQIYIKI